MLHPSSTPSTPPPIAGEHPQLHQPECLPAATEVLIVGAGPTGMALAIALQQAGVKHVIIDKLQQGLNTSRAGVIHAHTLEMLESLGVSRQLVQLGIPLSNFCIRNRQGVLLKLQFNPLPTPYHYLLMLPQDLTEKVLSDRLTALGGHIFRGVTATAVTQDPAGVSVTLATPSGPASLRAQYVVGADGMHSIVRAAAGIGFEGGTYEESFVLADVRMDWALANEVSLFFSPLGLVVVAPLPNGIFRVVATVHQAPEQPGVDDIQALLDSRGPAAGTDKVKEVLWSSRFRLHHRVANDYRNGRLLVMGDAAHVHSPAGGQGMNTGLVDAVVLGQLLARAVRSADGAAILDTYRKMRRPAASRVLALAGRLTTLATLRGAAKLALRNGLLSLINRLPPVRRRIAMELSGLSRRSFAQLPAAIAQSPAAVAPVPNHTVAARLPDCPS
ncbi:FAD-dependent monooxygenase [Paludibaculum fermentans]|uniref:FAD-dependent monooxygenase n=1 Tax=Paludibaculum fermentans TaxID=1473598 RepID=UPI003EBBA28C